MSNFTASFSHAKLINSFSFIRRWHIWKLSINNCHNSLMSSEIIVTTSCNSVKPNETAQLEIDYTCNTQTNWNCSLGQDPWFMSCFNTIVSVWFGGWKARFSPSSVVCICWVSGLQRFNSSNTTLLSQSLTCFTSLKRNSFWSQMPVFQTEMPNRFITWHCTAA